MDRKFGWDYGTAQWTLDVSTVCDICGEPFDNTTKYLDKAMDHDHTTGEFRGVVHNRCNLGIGLLKDSSDLCLKAAAYLDRP